MPVALAVVGQKELKKSSVEFPFPIGEGSTDEVAVVKTSYLYWRHFDVWVVPPEVK